MTIKELLQENLSVDTTTNCWLWTGRLNDNGYGVISLPNEDNTRNRDYLVHRLSFKVFNGIEPNLVLHKIECPHKNCFNPHHLYDGNHSDNIKDSRTTGVHANQWGKTNKTHCKNGHELNGENLIITSERRRRCKTCQKEYNKNNWKKYSIRATNE